MGDVLEQPTLVMTNTTSFVGVTAKIEPTCGCPARRGISTCQSNPCLNGGTCEDTTTRGATDVCAQIPCSSDQIVRSWLHPSEKAGPRTRGSSRARTPASPSSSPRKSQMDYCCIKALP